MKKAVSFICLILLVVILAGCSTFQKVITAGAKANDQALDTAEFTICKAATVGSIRRRYGTKAQAETWRALCDSLETDNFTPVVE